MYGMERIRNETTAAGAATAAVCLHKFKRKYANCVCSLSRSILTFSTFKLGCRAYCLFHVTFDGILFHSISVPLSFNTYTQNQRKTDEHYVAV